jgi:hypothetical protein
MQVADGGKFPYFSVIRIKTSTEYLRLNTGASRGVGGVGRREGVFFVFPMSAECDHGLWF